MTIWLGEQLKRNLKTKIPVPMIKQVKIIEQEMKNFSIKMEIQLLEFTGSLTINSAGEERCI